MKTQQKSSHGFFFVVVQEGMERATDWWTERDGGEVEEKMMELIDIAGVLIKASVE